MGRKKKDQQDGQAFINTGQSATGSQSHIILTIPDPLTVKQQSDPTSKKQYAEEKESRDSLLRAAKMLNYITILSAIISLFALAAVWYTLFLTKGQFAADQRPWALVAAIQDAKQDSAGRVLVPVYVANYGKTPALQTAVRGEVFVGGDAVAHAYQFFEAMEDSNTRMSRSGSYVTVPPGIPSDPTKTQIFTTLFSTAISTQDFSSDKANSMWIVTAVRVDYLDSSGHSYISEFCVGNLQTGAETHCTEHNLAK